MTDGELINRAKSGDKAARVELWEHNRGILYTMLKQLYDRYKGRAARQGVTFEDVQQIGYFAVVSAVNGFDPGAGVKFSSYLFYHVKNEFFTLLGLRTERQRRDPMADAQRMEEILPGTEDNITVGDAIPDQKAEAELEAVCERAYNAELRRALETQLGEIDPLEAEVVRSYYYSGKELFQVAAELGIPYQQAKRLNASAMRKLRSKARSLRRFCEEYTEDHAYQSTSFHKWKGRGSVEEIITERLELRGWI